MLRFALVSAYCLVSVVGLASGRTMRQYDRRANIPAGFTYVGPQDASTVLSIRLAMVQSNPGGLEEALYDVSTPSSPVYGQHLSKEEAAQFVAPSPEAVSAVNAWLQENDITATTLTPAGDWVEFQIPVSKANEIFNADYSVFKHESTGKQTIRTLSYSIPEELTDHVAIVHPTTTFPTYKASLPAFRKVSSRAANTGVTDAASSCADTITPACLQSLYNIPSTPATQTSNTLGVSGFSDQYANQADLATFLETYRTDMSSDTTFTVETLDGGSDPQDGSDAGDEANLDTQYTVGLATDVPVVFISVGENTNDGDLDGFLDIINYLLAQDAPPQVLTTSYGSSESDVPIAMAENLCNAYAQLGARGVSILFASGDGGVSGPQDSLFCWDFVPTFPSGCPYLTSVGATTGISPETAADFSSGGFSNYWGVPSYQQSAVSGYLSYLGDTYSGRYNASGRGYPDVSAQGENFNIVLDQDVESVSGTSCASPTFASVIALLNDELIAAGKSPLGFLNPWLYSTAASSLNDVTSGDNPGCFSDGFSATTGWDPVTGLGTPDYTSLRTAAGL